MWGGIHCVWVGHMCMGGAYVNGGKGYIWRSGDNLQESVLCFHHVVSRTKLRSPGLAAKEPLPAESSHKPQDVCSHSIK